MTSLLRKFYTICIVALMGFTLPAGAQDGYRLQPGDVLSIEVLEDPSLNRQVLVLPSGEFSFPFAGTIRAGGRTVSQVERAIVSGIASNFAAAPNVFASVQSVRPVEEQKQAEELAAETIDVFMIGELGAPGTKQLKPGTTFLQALALSGGFSQFAAKKRIQLRRSDKITGAQTLIKINYDALSRGAALKRDVILRDGDVILVPERRLFE